MGNKNTAQEIVINAIKGEKLDEMAVESEVLEIIETIIEANPQFKDMTFEQLRRNLEFRKKLKGYKLNNPSPVNTEATEVLKSVVPKKHVKPNNKLANNITKDIIDEGEFNLIVSGNKAKKEVTTKIMLNYESENVQMSSRIKYTPYDREVYDGVITLYAAGNNTITPAMVYRAMNGMTETEYVSPQSLETVRKSLDKSMRIYTVIDYTDEAKLYNKNIQKTKYEGYLLAATKITVKINGEEHEAYKILSPILYEYARISGQIITVPIKYLQTKNAVRSTDEVIIIRGYLLRQIAWMQNNKTNRSNNITYQGIYGELEISRIIYNEAMYKKKTHATRSHIKAILTEWKNEGYLMDFVEYKDGKTIAGVTIMI